MPQAGNTAPVSETRSSSSSVAAVLSSSKYQVMVREASITMLKAGPH